MFGEDALHGVDARRLEVLRDVGDEGAGLVDAAAGLADRPPGGVVEDAVICRSLKPESDALSNVGRERP